MSGAFLFLVKPESRRAACLPGDWQLRGGRCKTLEKPAVFHQCQCFYLGTPSAAADLHGRERLYPRQPGA